MFSKDLRYISNEDICSFVYSLSAKIGLNKRPVLSTGRVVVVTVATIAAVIALWKAFLFSAIFRYLRLSTKISIIYCDFVCWNTINVRSAVGLNS